ncbi:hypothetical protein LWI29_035086 [Acer saccharum]|uniref:Uncharacterized protein n=1 Tax=Acer saccharum TaxID=4024 RepID=A0AA39SK67_ACESA|nr:hypothetical protein LWI29_035086 [Acer saccharum]
MSKKLIVFGICMLLACTLFVQEADARYIGYGAIGRDENQGCGPKHPELCTEGPPANHYNRGCEALDRCRSGAKEEMFRRPPVFRHGWGSVSMKKMKENNE